MRRCALVCALAFVLSGNAHAADPILAFRFTWSGAAIYSPMREFAVAKVPSGLDLVSKKRFGVSVGLEARYAPFRVPFQFGFRADFVQPLGGGTATNGVTLSQNIVRFTGRGVWALRGNLYEGPMIFGGVTSSRVYTKFDTYSLRENLSGWTVGCGWSTYGYKHTDQRWYEPVEYEIGIHRLPVSSRGTKAGGLTMECRVSFKF